MHVGPRPHLDALRRRYEARRNARIEVRPQSATVGAEIGGVDLRALDDETFAEVEQALYDYEVVIFRDQEIGNADHLAFARRFGELEQHPFLPSPDGEPVFSDMVTAYEGLPDELRARIDGLTAVHDFTRTFGFGLSEEERLRRCAATEAC